MCAEMGFIQLCTISTAGQIGIDDAIDTDIAIETEINRDTDMINVGAPLIMENVKGM